MAKRLHNNSHTASTLRRILLPFDFHDIPRAERWLCEMTEQGMFLAGIRGMFAYFEQDTPKSLRYLLTPTLCGKATASERRQTLTQYGWNYIADYQNYLQVYCTADPSVVIPQGLYTSAGSVYEDAGRREGTAAAIVAVTSLAAILLIILCVITGRRFLISAVEGIYEIPTALMLIDAMFILASIQEMHSHKLLLTRIQEGMLIENAADISGRTVGEYASEHTLHPVRRKNGSSASSLLCRVAVPVLCLVLGVSAIFIGAASLKKQLQTDLPPAISSLLSETYDLFESLEDYSEGDSAANASVSIQNGSSFLAPIICTISLEDIFEDRTWTDSNLSYNPALRLQYYELRFDWLSKALLDKLIEQYMTQLYWEGDVLQTDLFSDKYEQIVLLQDEGNTSCLFTISGNEISVLTYYGEGALSPFAF